MTRGRLRAATLWALPCTAFAVVACARPVAATSTARLIARESALASVGGSPGEPGADAAMVAAAWSAGGFVATGAAASTTGAQGARADALFLALCGRVLGTGPSDPPAAGDLIHYADAGASRRGVSRIGIFVTGGEVVVYDTALQLVGRVERQRLLPDDRVTGPVVDLAIPGSAVACAINPAVIPGAADVDPSVGSVSLVDPNTAADRLDFTASHPRDGDSGVWHTVSGAGRGLLGKLGAAVAFGGAAVAGAIDWLHDHELWFPGLTSVILVAWLSLRALTATADLRGLHAVLVTVVAIGALFTPIGQLAVVVAAAVALTGRLTGWWSAGSVAGGLRAVFWNVAVFSVDTLTGIDGSGHTSLLAVGVALVGDFVIVAKPLALGARAAPALARLAGNGRIAAAGSWVASWARPVAARTLYTASTMSDVLVAKPSTLVDLANAGVDAARTTPRAASTVVGHLADVASVAYRGPTVLAPDALTAFARAAGVFADAGRGVASPATMQITAALLSRADAATQRMILEAALPALRDFGNVGHLRSGASALSATLQGRPPVRLPQSPSPVPSTSWTEGYRPR